MLASDAFSTALAAVCVVWVGFEVGFSILSRARGGAAKRDAGSQWLLYGATFGGAFAGVYLAMRGVGMLPLPMWLRWAGIALIVAGLAFRLWAIVTLRRFFTVDVAVHQDHKVVTTGPYAIVRHPGYAGGLLSFIGFALALSSWVSALVMLLLIGAAYAYRIHVEEAALMRDLPGYAEYAQRVYRLIPWVC